MQTVVSRVAIKWQVFILGLFASVWLIGQALFVRVFGGALAPAQFKLAMLVATLVGVLIVLGLTYSIGQLTADAPSRSSRGCSHGPRRPYPSHQPRRQG